MAGCNPNAQNIEVYKSCINFQHLCNHFDEYGISLKMPEEDASNRNAEGLMALKIKVVAKVVEHFDMDLSSISPIRVDRVIGMHSQILLFIHDLKKLGNFLFNKSITPTKGTNRELMNVSIITQVIIEILVLSLAENGIIFRYNHLRRGDYSGRTNFQNSRLALCQCI